MVRWVRWSRGVNLTDLLALGKRSSGLTLSNSSLCSLHCSPLVCKVNPLESPEVQSMKKITSDYSFTLLRLWGWIWLRPLVDLAHLLYTFLWICASIIACFLIYFPLFGYVLPLFHEEPFAAHYRRTLVGFFSWAVKLDLFGCLNPLGEE